MGAEQFVNYSLGKNAKDAFKSAKEVAQYERGHGGYSGTIAEKDSFKMVTPNAGESPSECVHRCSDDPNHFSDDKWGPAGCVDAGPAPKHPGFNEYIFFGYASS
jgi:hypothetical protein